MMFGTEISRLDAKPFNIFTCILQLLQPAGHSATPPVQTSPCGPRYFTALSGFFSPHPVLDLSTPKLVNDLV